MSVKMTPELAAGVEAALVNDVIPRKAFEHSADSESELLADLKKKLNGTQPPVLSVTIPAQIVNEAPAKAAKSAEDAVLLGTDKPPAFLPTAADEKNLMDELKARIAAGPSPREAVAEVKPEIMELSGGLGRNAVKDSVKDVASRTVERGATPTATYYTTAESGPAAKTLAEANLISDRASGPTKLQQAEADRILKRGSDEAQAAADKRAANPSEVAATDRNAIAYPKGGLALAPIESDALQSTGSSWQKAVTQRRQMQAAKTRGGPE